MVYYFKQFCQFIENGLKIVIILMEISNFECFRRKLSISIKGIEVAQFLKFQDYNFISQLWTKLLLATANRQSLKLHFTTLICSLSPPPATHTILLLKPLNLFSYKLPFKKVYNYLKRCSLSYLSTSPAVLILRTCYFFLIEIVGNYRNVNNSCWLAFPQN